MRRPATILAILVLVALPVGCGNDDGSADAGTTTATATTATTPVDTTPATGATATTTLPQGAPRTERDRLSGCLTKEGYRLQGGAVPGDDSELPDYQIIFSGPRGGGYIGFYKNASRAKRVAKQLRDNAQRISGASIERHGSINIVWVDLADAAARANVRGCLVT